MANETILIVDTDRKSQKVLEVSFKKAGHRVVITESIAEAHEEIRRVQPSLIIADTALPDGDGLEFCADLKIDPATHSIPLIFLTENQSLTHKMRAFEIGADDYLTKPIYIKEVVTRADLLIQRRAKELLSESDIEEFEGDLEEITMIDLLQTIEKENRSGSVRLQREGRQGAIFFRDGQILDAVCGKLQGEFAVYRLMLWPEGEFVVRYHSNSRRMDHIKREASDLLLEGIRRLEIVAELSQDLPEADRVFEADYQRLPSFLRSVPPEVERVVRLFDGYRQFHEVVGDSPLDDVTTLQIVERLLQEEILADITPSATKNPEESPGTLDQWLYGGTQAEEMKRELSEPQEEPASQKVQETPPQNTTEISTETTDRIAKPPVGKFLDSTEHDEIDTEELPREEGFDSPSNVPTPEGLGGGHWKFHWGTKTPSEGLPSAVEAPSFDLPADGQAPLDEPIPQVHEEESESPSPTPVNSPQPLEEPSSEAADSLREMEEQEQLRRAEEARRLEAQLRAAEPPLIEESEESHAAPEETPVGQAPHGQFQDEPVVPTLENLPSDQELPEESPLESTSPTDQEEYRRDRATTPLSSPALAMAGLLEDDDGDEENSLLSAREREEDLENLGSFKRSERSEKPTGRIGVPEEIKMEQQRRREQARNQEGNQELGSEEAPPSREASNTQEIDPHQFEPFDPEYFEDTGDFDDSEDTPNPFAPQVKEPEGQLIEPGRWTSRNAEDQKIVLVEFELKRRNSSRRKQRDFAAGLPAEEDPTPVPFPTPIPLSQSDLQEKPEDQLVEQDESREPEKVDTLDPIVPSPEVLAELEAANDASAASDASALEVKTTAAESDDQDTGPEKREELSEEPAPPIAQTGEELAEDSIDTPPIEATDKVAATEESSEKRISEEKVAAKPVGAPPETRKADEPSPSEKKEESENEIPSTGEKKEKPRKKEDQKAAIAPVVRSQELPAFDEDFEADLGIGSNSWQKWAIFAAIASLIAVVLAFASLSGSDAEDPETDPGIAVAEEPQEDETSEEEPAELAMEEPEPSGDGLDSGGAEMRAEMEAFEIMIAAREIAQKLGEVRTAQEAAQREEAAAAAAAGSPAASTPSQEAPAPPAAERTIAQDLQRLRAMIDRDQIDQALPLARELTASNPNNRQVAFLHGQAALYANQNTEAIEHLRRARQLGLNTGDLYLELATAYQVTGQRDQARQAYESFLEVQPTGRAADEVRTILEGQF